MEILSNIASSLATAAIIAVGAGAGIFLGKSLKEKKSTADESK